MPDAHLPSTHASVGASATAEDASPLAHALDAATRPALHDATTADSNVSAADGSIDASDGITTDGGVDPNNALTDAATPSTTPSSTTPHASIDASDSAAPPACSPDEDPTCPCPDEQSRVEYCADADRDGYCSDNCGYWACPGNTNPNWLLRASCTADCEDTDEAIHPQAVDVCNGVNDDCDNTVDEDFQTAECPYEGLFGSEGACFNAGTTTCEGHVNCLEPTNEQIGQATPRATAAPNGSWDWDCDGNVETSIEAGAASGDQCTGSDTCQIVYRDEPSLLNHGCGQQVTLDPCQRDQNTGQCVHAPASGGTQTLLCH